MFIVNSSSKASRLTDEDLVVAMKIHAMRHTVLKMTGRVERDIDLVKWKRAILRTIVPPLFP